MSIYKKQFPLLRLTVGCLNFWVKAKVLVCRSKMLRSHKFRAWHGRDNSCDVSDRANNFVQVLFRLFNADFV